MIAFGEQGVVRRFFERRFRGHIEMAEESRSNPDQMRLGYTLALITMALGILDVISTDAGLASGFAREANPIMAGMMGTIGGYYFVPKMMITAAIATLIIWSPSRPTLAVMAICSGWMTSVVTNNFLIGLGYPV